MSNLLIRMDYFSNLASRGYVSSPSAVQDSLILCEHTEYIPIVHVANMLESHKNGGTAIDRRRFTEITYDENPYHYNRRRLIFTCRQTEMWSGQVRVGKRRNPNGFTHFLYGATMMQRSLHQMRMLYSLVLPQHLVKERIHYSTTLLVNGDTIERIASDLAYSKLMESNIRVYTPRLHVYEMNISGAEFWYDEFLLSRHPDLKGFSITSLLNPLLRYFSEKGVKVMKKSSQEMQSLTYKPKFNFGSISEFHSWKSAMELNAFDAVRSQNNLKIYSGSYDASYNSFA